MFNFWVSSMIEGHLRFLCISPAAGLLHSSPLWISIAYSHAHNELKIIWKTLILDLLQSLLHAFLHFRWGERDKNHVGISSLRRTHTLLVVQVFTIQVRLIVTSMKWPCCTDQVKTCNVSSRTLFSIISGFMPRRIERDRWSRLLWLMITQRACVCRLYQVLRRHDLRMQFR